MDEDCRALIILVSSYFFKSPVDGLYYLREGYCSLPQSVIIKLKTLAETLA